jgi:hypothetical protein
LPDPARPRGRDRTLVVSGAALFLVSTAFPVLASIRGPEPLSTWVGMADVTVAFLVVLAGIAITFRKPVGFEGRTVASAFEIYRSGATLFLVLLALFFVVGERIRWSILLPGLAWRAWIFAWALPSALALWHTNADTPSKARGEADGRPGA